jgi:hypothetical protein
MLSEARFAELKTQVSRIREQFEDRFRGPIQATWNSTLLAIARELIEDREERQRREAAAREP